MTDDPYRGEPAGHDQYRTPQGDPSYAGPPAYPYGHYPPYPQPQPQPYPQGYFGPYQEYAGGPQPGYGPYGPQPAHPGQPSAAKPKRRRLMAGVGAGVVAAALVAGGVALVSGGSGQLLSGSGAFGGLSDGNSGANPGVAPSGPSLPSGGTGGTGGSGSGGSGGTTSAQVATGKQQKGVVTIVSVLGYQNAESAGTGMILTANGEILTNNHVINGATSITVTVESTGKSYKANVVGTSPAQDVAVIQLRGASGLTTANVGDSDDVKTGDAITGVGNAGGTGTLRASAGKVTALDQSITATDDSGANAEHLSGLIGVDAGIIAGDSGGPMYDSSGEIIGMNTAASSSSGAGGSGGGQFPGGSTSGGTGQTTAYAIPIDHAISVADQIEKGVETATVHVGLPGFIGVGVQDANGQGAGITSVLAGGPAAKAGITEGSTITAVDGKSVTSGDSLKTALSTHKPGSSVKMTWTDSSGASHTATVTLITGPAD